MTSEWVGLGRVRSVRPGQRQVRVDARPGYETQFVHADWLYVRTGREAPARHPVAAVEVQARCVLVTLAGSVSMDNVAAMRKVEVVVKRDELKLVEGPVPAAALQGFDVLDTAGERIGRIATVYEAPGNDVIEIEETGGGSVLLPVVDATIERVDLAHGTVTVFEIDPFRQEA